MAIVDRQYFMWSYEAAISLELTGDNRSNIDTYQSNYYALGVVSGII